MKSAQQVRDILKDVKYQNWLFYVAEDSKGWPTYLQVKFEAPCTTTGEEQGWSGRKWQLSKHMTRSEIVTTAFKAVLTAVEHEARESFTYKGQPIFGPHIDVEALVKVYETDGPHILDVREKEYERRSAIPQ